MKAIFKKFSSFLAKHPLLLGVCMALMVVSYGVFLARDSLPLYPDFAGSITKDSLVDFAEDIFALGASVGAALCFIFEPLFELFFRFLRKKSH